MACKAELGHHAMNRVMLALALRRLLVQLVLMRLLLWTVLLELRLSYCHVSLNLVHAG